jgi:hypothetical protein
LLKGAIANEVFVADILVQPGKTQSGLQQACDALLDAADRLMKTTVVDLKSPEELKQSDATFAKAVEHFQESVTQFNGALHKAKDGNELPGSEVNSIAEHVGLKLKEKAARAKADGDKANSEFNQDAEAYKAFVGTLPKSFVGTLPKSTDSDKNSPTDVIKRAQEQIDAGKREIGAGKRVIDAMDREIDSVKRDTEIMRNMTDALVRSDYLATASREITNGNELIETSTKNRLAHEDKISLSDNPDYTLLRSVEDGDVEKARRAIGLGADVNVSNARKRSPLLIAAERGDEKMVDLLLGQKDLRINLQDDIGYTALHHAADNLNDTIIAKLKRAGADDTIKSSTTTPVTPKELVQQKGSWFPDDEKVQQGVKRVLTALSVPPDDAHKKPPSSRPECHAANHGNEEHFNLKPLIGVAVAGNSGVFRG